MKKLLLALLLITFASCSKDEIPINSKEKIYGNYLAIDTMQYIQQFNPAEPYLLIVKKDSANIRHYDYQILNNHFISNDGYDLFEIVEFDGNNLKVIEEESGKLLVFQNKY